MAAKVVRNDPGISRHHPHPAGEKSLLPHLILRRTGREKHLTGIKELGVGVGEGQHTALGQLGGQFSAFHVQSLLLWEPDGCETSEATGVTVPGEGTIHPPHPPAKQK